MQHLHWILHLSCWVQSFLSFQAPHLCTVFSNFCKLREELKVTEHYTKKKLLNLVSRDIMLNLIKYPVIVYCFAVGLHSVPGGVFPVPPVAAHLMTLLPPPSCFQVVYCRLVVHSLNLFILVFLVTMFPPITWIYFLHINAQTTHNSSIRSEKGLMLETSALKHLMMANLHYQHSQ